MAYKSLRAQWHIAAPPFSQQPVLLIELELVGHLNSPLGRIMLFHRKWNMLLSLPPVL